MRKLVPFPNHASLETDDVIFHMADILPLRKGHTLIIPKTHVARLSELPAEYAAAIGEAVSKVANALTQGKSLPRFHFNRRADVYCYPYV